MKPLGSFHEVQQVHWQKQMDHLKPKTTECSFNRCAIFYEALYLSLYLNIPPKSNTRYVKQYQRSMSSGGHLFMYESDQATQSILNIRNQHGSAHDWAIIGNKAMITGGRVRRSKRAVGKIKDMYIVWPSSGILDHWLLATFMDYICYWNISCPD